MAEWVNGRERGLYSTATKEAAAVYAMLANPNWLDEMTDLLAALQEIHAARLAELAAQQAQ
ncbi:hypothetical protein [Aeromonas sanarellii]|uniref:hypothetical protein n=1 Tax=Aeromonas sanarellii TaxID=633415 RepID=UPI003B9F4C20